MEGLNTKDYLFELKEVGENGVFEGFLSVYDVVDLGNDVVEKGAFSKTIQENKGRIPLLWQHDHRNPIGYLDLEDREKGLWVKGHLLMDDDLPDAKKAYKLIKTGIVKGLSIGFRTVKDKVEDGVRRLKELVLHEGSIVTFPMLPQAQIARVKAENLWPFPILVDLLEHHLKEHSVSRDDLGKLAQLLESEAASTPPAEAGSTSDEEAGSTSKGVAGRTSDEEAASTPPAGAEGTPELRKFYRGTLGAGLDQLKSYFHEDTK